MGTRREGIQQEGPQHDGAVAGDAAPALSVALLALSSPEHRRAVEAGLAGTGVARIVHAAPTDAAVAAGSGQPGGVAVLEWPDGDGGPVAVLAALRRAGWPHVVVVGSDRRTATVVRALTTGARGYLLGAPPPAGGRTPGREQADCALSGRELQVLALAAEGLSNHEIGHELGLSALTVKSHLARMTRRLGARDRAHLVLLAMRSGALP